MNKFLSMAALALVGAIMTGCSSDDSFIDNPQQPENTGKVVTLTTTVSLDGGATRALTADGVKTFADGDKMAVIYKNSSDETVKAEGTITSGVGTNSATFTFTLTDPKKSGEVKYIYPAAMAGATDVDYTKLNSQDGTLATLGSNLDLCTKSGAWVGDNLPTLSLENELAILAITLKNSDGSSEITSTITSMTVGDGTNTYSVTRAAAAGPIYVAIRPTSSANIDVTATDGTKGYLKTLDGKTYAANNGYSVSWKMKLSTVTWNTTNVFNEEHRLDLLSKAKQTPLTYEGITISFSGEGTASLFKPGNPDGKGNFLGCLTVFGNSGDSYHFTAPTGKIFTKIEMTDNTTGTLLADANWSKDGKNKLVWNGTPSNTVTIAGTGQTKLPYLISIVFTLTDE